MPKRKADTISLTQLFRMFPDENSCYAWLERTRWGDQPVCPHCGGVDNISQPPSKPHHYWHKDCRKQFTVTTKTCMHATKRPLQDWIFTIYTVLTARKGISALQLSKELGCQYRTAWHMLHRIREACSGGDFSLERVVEVDETYVGGKSKNMHKAKRLNAGRGTVGKTPVVGARQRGGRVKAEPVERTDAPTLIGFVESAVEPGSTVYTDDARAYDAHTNSIEAVWAVFKRSVNGTWHHVSPKHLHRYVDEATFRLNDGNCEVDTIDRMESLVRGTGGKRLRYRDLTA